MGGIDRAEPSVGIERFGEIQADLAAGVPRGDVLAGGRLTDAQLVAVTDHWLAAMAQEVRRGRTALAQRYARAYIARRPDLLRDPEADGDRLAALAAASAPPPAAPGSVGDAPARPSRDAAPPVDASPPREVTPRFVPSYLLDDTAKSQPARAAPVALAPPVVVPNPVIVPPPSAPARPAASKLQGTMLAMDIPASFKAIPFSREPTPAPASRAAPPPSSTVAGRGSPPSPAARSSTVGPSRPPITGTAAFELPEHIRNMPLGVPPRAPPPPTGPQLPSLEEYVRLGVELGATPPDRVDAVLAAARWTRVTWATVDQSYRSRLAREPALQVAFQAALAAERARRAGARR